MSEVLLVEQALVAAVADLAAERQAFALVGGLAVSVRAEVRFTRDVDLAVSVKDDTEAEALVFRLQAKGYGVLASVEHEVQARLSTVRLLSPSRVKVDLLFASSGIEREIVSRAAPVSLPGAGLLPVARAEELLAMKVLSMNEQRLQDRIDASKLLSHNPEMNLDEVRASLRTITARGFNRGEDLEAKLAALLRAYPRA